MFQSIFRNEESGAVSWMLNGVEEGETCCLQRDSVLEARLTLSPIAVGSILVSVPNIPINVLPVFMPNCVNPKRRS